MKALKIIALATAVTCSMGANASIIDSSLFVEGDNRATLDTDTGLEWLKLSETKGFSYNEILQEIAYGGEFSGWRLPTYEEAIGYTSAVIDSTGYNNINTNGESDSVVSPHINQVRSILADVGATLGSTSTMYSGSATGVTGLYYNNEGDLKYLRSYTNGIHTKSGYIFYNFSFSQDKDTGNDTKAFFLVSDGGDTLSSKLNPEININNPNALINDVPTPLIGAFGMLALLAAGRKRLNKRGVN
jgi:hypothetical protein